MILKWGNTIYHLKKWKMKHHKVSSLYQQIPNYSLEFHVSFVLSYMIGFEDT